MFGGFCGGPGSSEGNDDNLSLAYGSVVQKRATESTGAAANMIGPGRSEYDQGPRARSLGGLRFLVEEAVWRLLLQLKQKAQRSSSFFEGRQCIQFGICGIQGA